MTVIRFVIAICLFIAGTPAFAARCGGDFQTFVATMSQEAQAAGISREVISQALSGVTQDPAVLSFDRRQRGTFNKTFEQYVSTRVGAGRINMVWVETDGTVYWAVAEHLVPTHVNNLNYCLISGVGIINFN